MEQYVNLFSTVVAVGGYTAGSGVLNVSSTTGITLNAGDTLALLVYRVIAGAITPIVILKATAVNSSTQFAVVAEGTDTNALANDTVENVLTARGLDQVRADGTVTDTTVNLPTNSKKGDIFLPNDSSVLYRSTGSAFVPWGPIFPFTLPVSGNFTNFGFNGTGATTTKDTSHGFITIRQQGSGTTPQIAGITKSKLASTFTVTFAITGFGNQVTDNQFGICLTDGTKYIVMAMQYFSSGVYLNVSKYTSITAFSADYQAIGGIMFACPVLFFRVIETVSARTFYASSDGQNFIKIRTGDTNTDFLTTTGYGVFVRGDGAASDTMVTLHSIVETNP